MFSPSLPFFCCSLTYWKILKSIVLSLSCSPTSSELVVDLQRSGKLQGVREEATGEAREVSLSLKSSLRPGEEGGDSKGDSSGLFVGNRKSSEASLMGGDFLLLAISRQSSARLSRRRDTEAGFWLRPPQRRPRRGALSHNRRSDKQILHCFGKRSQKIVLVSGLKKSMQNPSWEIPIGNLCYIILSQSNIYILFDHLHPCH